MTISTILEGLAAASVTGFKFRWTATEKARKQIETVETVHVNVHAMACNHSKLLMMFLVCRCITEDPSRRVGAKRSEVGMLAC